MELVLEKKIKRYCLACIEDNYCFYLKSLHRIGGWELVTDIEQATKADSKSIMRMVRDNYERDMGTNASKLVVVPVVIDYSLVKEIED